MLLPGLVMAPVTAAYEFPEVVGEFDVSVLVTSRYFYLSLVGLAILFCGLTTSLLRSIPRPTRAPVTVIVACLLAGQAALHVAASRRIAT